MSVRGPRIQTTFGKVLDAFNDRADEMLRSIDKRALLSFATIIEARQVSLTFNALVDEDDVLEAAKVRGSLRELESFLNDVVMELERRERPPEGEVSNATE